MKTKSKKSLLLYVGVFILLAVPVVSIGLMSANVITEIVHKRRLAHGVQILATVTDRKSHFSVTRGGGYNAYDITYEFRYTDRQTGQTKKQVQTDYGVYRNDYELHTPGSTFIALFLPAEPAINEPATAIKRLNPQSMLLVRTVTSLAFVGAIIALLTTKFPRLLRQSRSPRRLVAAMAILFAALVTGFMLGRGAVGLIEHALLAL